MDLSVGFGLRHRLYIKMDKATRLFSIESVSSFQTLYNPLVSFGNLLIGSCALMSFRLVMALAPDALDLRRSLVLDAMKC